MSRFTTGRLRLTVSVASLVLCLLSQGAKADSLKIRKVGVHTGNDSLKVTFGFKDIFSRQVKRKLKSGLPTRLIVQVSVENSRRKQVAFWARTTHVVYDLWEENFKIILEDPGGRKTARVESTTEVLQVTGALRHEDVARGLKSGKYRLKVLIEANPVSEKMVRNIQRWISSPSGRLGEKSSGRNYFGSFVGYFVDRNIGKADKSVGFISQWFEL